MPMARPWMEERTVTLPIIIPRGNDFLSHTLDLDSLFGNMSFDKFKDTFKQKIDLEINNSPASVYAKTYRIKTDHTIYTPETHKKRINELPHVRIGSAKYTDFGSLDIYIVVQTTKYDDMELKATAFQELKQSIVSYFSKAASCQFLESKPLISKSNDVFQCEQITGNVRISDFSSIMEHLINKRLDGSKPLIYFETFGNKRLTISNKIDFKIIEETISSCFKQEALNDLHIDACISSSFGNGKITLANCQFFESMKLTPNYMPLFTNAILNCHQKSTDRKTGAPVRTGVFNKVEKINFYSTFKYFFKIDKTPHYVFPLSQSLMLNNFYGHVVFSNPNKLSKYIETFSNIQKESVEGLKSGTCVYRTEIRAMYHDMENELSELYAHLVPKNFHFFDSVAFFEILQVNIMTFLNLIESSGTVNLIKSIDDFSYSLVAEYIFKTLFLTGFKYTSSLPEYHNEIINNTIKQSKDSVVVLRNVKETIDSVHESLTGDEKRKLIANQIDFMFRPNNFKKTLFNELVKISFSLQSRRYLKTTDEYIDNMLNWFAFERSGGSLKNYEILKQPVIDTQTTGVSVALKKYFIQQNIKSRSAAAKIFFHLFKIRFKIETDNSGLNMVADYMKQNSIVTIFKSLVVGKLETILLKYDSIPDKNVAIEIVENRNREIAYADLIREPIDKPLNIKGISEDELVRYIHASYKYAGKSMRLKSILCDFAYGFFPVRNSIWIKNKTTQIYPYVFKNDFQDSKGKEKYFKDLMLRVKEWTPEKFTMEDRIQYMATHGIVLGKYLMEKYKTLVILDSESWWNSGIANEINEKFLDDLFLKAVSYNKIYNSEESFLKSFRLSVLDDVRLPTRAVNKNINFGNEEVTNTEQEISNDDDYFHIQNYQGLENYSSTSFQIISEFSSKKPPVVRCKAHKIVSKIKNFAEPERQMNEERKVLMSEKTLESIESSKDIHDEAIKFTQETIYDDSITFSPPIIIPEPYPEIDNIITEIKPIMLPFQMEIDEINNTGTEECGTEANFFDDDGPDFDFNSLTDSIQIYENQLVSRDELNTSIITSSSPGNKSSYASKQGVSKIKENNFLPNFSRIDSTSSTRTSFLSLNDIKLDDINIDLFTTIVSKLFRKYRYKKFILSDARNSLFSIQRRPSAHEWKAKIKMMIEKGYLTAIKIRNGYSYKFNLMIPNSDKFITHFYLVKLIRNYLSHHQIKYASQATIRNCLDQSLRPPSAHLGLFLNTMVEEGDLRSIVLQNKPYYSI